MADTPVMAYGTWPTNSDLICDIVRLGYLWRDSTVWDATFAGGGFWRLWRPERLVATDIVLSRSPYGVAVDFTASPFKDREFDCVVLDPPYGLRGTPSDAGGMDTRYGTDVKMSRKVRHAMICAGITECARVLGNGYLMLKCASQVEGSKVRWQPWLFAEHAETVGLGLVDQLEFPSYRPQPVRTRADGKPSVQQHARRNTSSLLVLKRGHKWRDA